MSKIKPIITKTPKTLAEALGLSAADAKGWQVRYDLLKRSKRTTKRKKTAFKRAGL